MKIEIKVTKAELRTLFAKRMGIQPEKVSGWKVSRVEAKEVIAHQLGLTVPFNLVVIPDENSDITID